nr:ORF1 [Torque teno felis virus]
MYRRRRRPRRWRHRRGSYYPFLKRWRRKWRRGRWRSRRRVGYHSVLQHLPKRHKYITVRGWEPLGNVCVTDGAPAEATPYFSVEPQANVSTAVWHGTWGHHYFTFNNLLQRSLARWNLFSGDWESYDYIMFLGGSIMIPQTSHIMWMINFDEYLQTKLVRYNEKSKEDHWGHPGILINTPKTHIIYPPYNYHRQRYYKVRIRPPPGWQGAQRFPEAMSYILCHWIWSWCDLENAFWDVRCQDTANVCEAAPWWAGNQYVAGKWVDRTKYDAPSCGVDKNKNWGPFLPQNIMAKQYQCSLFFLYKLRFKLVGNALWRALPRQFQSQGMVPEPEGPNQPSVSEKHKSETEQSRKKKRKRPRSVYDIWPEDLDSDGIIKERALRRITGDCQRDEQPPLEKRFKHLHDKLKLVLGRYKLLKQ